jgi:hypothetical protein
MPAVSTALHRALGIAPTAVDQPELAVAEGSVRMGSSPPVDVDGAWPVGPVTVGLPPPDPHRRRLPRFRSRTTAVAAAVLAAAVIASVGAVTLNGRPRTAGAGDRSPSAGPTASPASPGATASPSPEPGKDPCLVGTWRRIHMEKQNEVAGQNYAFTGGAGEILTFGADGRFTEDFTPAAPLTVVINGVTWQEINKGSASGSYQARNGVLLYSNTAATGTWMITRNGRRNAGGPLRLSVEPEQYICSNDALTMAASFYTSSWSRVGPPPS